MMGFAERRDFDAAAGLLADAAVWHTPDADHSGRDAIVGYMRASFEGTEVYEIDTHDVLESDDHVVLLGTMRARTPTKSFESPYVWVFHVEQGRITEGWTVAFDGAGRTEFLAP